MVSTYVPTASPVMLRLQATVPLPVPLAEVNVVQLFFDVADQVVVDELVPVNVTVALSPGAAFPCCTDTLRDPGLTATTTGIGAGVMRSVS